ncbi:MAG: interleukin-like EMT inducer domain-containing protein [Coleofasciculus sp. C1-SOL-03]|uniref:interleukin-like EMT inducer domain-containing protein n=1 Tax=Coleofasciculus sp. C1-SOL-03 TaxID=3069522 RepID=UPI0033009DD3
MNPPNVNPARNGVTTTVQVSSAGYDHGNSASIKRNTQDLGENCYNRGLNVAVFDEFTGQPMFGTTFDTFNSGNSESFAQFVSTLPPGRIVAIAIKDDASLNLSDPGKRACKSLGSRLIDHLQFRSSWAIIGQTGAASGTAVEQLSDESAVTCSREITATKVQVPSFVVAAISAGNTWGNMAQVTCNGELVSLTGGYQRGLNVVVFDPSNGRQLQSRSFDIYADPANADAFADWIETIPQGRVVAIAAKDDASFNLSDRAKAACKLIGSTQIDRLQFRGSWAIVGVKGASGGAVIENLNNFGSVSVNAWFPVLDSPPVTPSVTQPVAQPIESRESGTGNQKQVVIIGLVLAILVIVVIGAILINQD